MGSTLGPTTGNVFLSFHKFKWLEQCPKEFKLVFAENILMKFFSIRIH